MKRKDGKETVRMSLIRFYTQFLDSRYEGSELEKAMHVLKRKTTKSLVAFNNMIARRLEAPFYGMDKRQIRKARRKSGLVATFFLLLLILPVSGNYTSEYTGDIYSGEPYGIRSVQFKGNGSIAGGEETDIHIAVHITELDEVANTTRFKISVSVSLQSTLYANFTDFNIATVTTNDDNVYTVFSAYDETLIGYDFDLEGDRTFSFDGYYFIPNSIISDSQKPSPISTFLLVTLAFFLIIIIIGMLFARATIKLQKSLRKDFIFGDRPRGYSESDIENGLKISNPITGNCCGACGTFNEGENIFCLECGVKMEGQS